MYKVIQRLLQKHWTGKQQRFVIAKVAKALVDECWYFVGASTRKNAIIRFFDRAAFVEIVDFVPVTEIYVPVSSVAAEIADLIPRVGCDPDEVAKGIAIRAWRLAQGYSYNEPILTVDISPKKQATSLFDYCK